MYPTLTNFIQRKRKSYDANNLIALSLVNIIVYIYSIGKRFYCTYLKTTAWDDIFFVKTFNEKMREHHVQIWRKKNIFQLYQLMI